MRILTDLIITTDRVIDLTKMLPEPRVRLIAREKGVFFTDLDTFHTPFLNLGEIYTLRIDPFRTLRMLDLANPELFGVSFWQKWRGEGKRPRIVNLCPKLHIPYDSLDIRPMEGTWISEEDEKEKGSRFSFFREVKYPDLFVRTLPFSRKVLRFFRIRRWLWKKIAYGIGIFLMALVIFGVPFLQYLKYSFRDAENRIIHILTASGNAEVQADILSARSTFERANIFLSPFFFLLDNSLIHVDQIESAHALVDAGLATTRGLDALARTLSGSFMRGEEQNTDTEESITPTYRAPPRDLYLLKRFGIMQPTLWYGENRDAVETFLREMRQAHDALRRFTTIGDADRDRRIIDASDALGRLVAYGDFFLQYETDVLRMLGKDVPMRYIVFNQNRDEIRANGGFPGTIFTFTLFQGNILKYRKDDVYYYDWNLFPNAEVPPAGLEEFGKFGLRDVTYYPLFRESLEKANNLIEKSGEETITTGIAIHQGVIEDILAKVGPVSLSGITEPFTSENFSPLMSTLVEAKYAREKTPKDILFTFADELEKKVVHEGRIDTVFSTLESYLQRGEIIIRSRDATTDAFLRSFHVFDTFISDRENWAYPIFTNIGGNKSDRFMTRHYERSATLVDDCRVENTLTIEAENSFTGAHEKQILSYLDSLQITDIGVREKLLAIEGKSPNRAYVRIITPFGSRLTGDTTGITVDSSRLDSTMFSFEMETPISGKSQQIVQYISRPNKCTEDGRIYKQPGLRVR